MTSQGRRRSAAWNWVPSLYLAEGLPYAVVMELAVIMFKRLGISNTDIALSTSWLYLPWVIKPLWSPLVDLVGTRRAWIISLQLIIGALLAGIAFMIPLRPSLQWVLCLLWLLAFSSATQDTAIDGFYMHGLTESDQAAFIGIRNASYRTAMIAGQGAVAVLVGRLEGVLGLELAWSAAFAGLSIFFVVSCAYHWAALPVPMSDKAPAAGPAKRLFPDFFRTFGAFFRRRGIMPVLAFLLLYRIDKALLVKLASPFLLDPRASGGIGLTTGQVGIASGTIGVLAITFGGLLGGYVISKQGLKYWLWIMVAALHIPDAAYVYLAYAKPDNLLLVSTAVAVEQFGYGFGFAAYVVFMILTAEGQHKTAHYAICSGFMALGMMLPGMFSGSIQDFLGYKSFFVLVTLLGLAGCVAAACVDIPPEFGKTQPRGEELGRVSDAELVAA